MVVDIKRAFAERLHFALDTLEAPPVNYGRYQHVCSIYNEHTGENLTLEAIRKWLTGLSMPAGGRLILLAESLGISPHYLLTGEGAILVSEKKIAEEAVVYSRKPKHTNTEERQSLVDAVEKLDETEIRLFHMILNGLKQGLSSLPEITKKLKK